VTAWQKLEAAAKKLERELKSAKLQKPSQLYQLLIKSPGEQVLYLLVYSTERLVQDRIRNYFQKYLPLSLEVTDEVVVATGIAVGSRSSRRQDEMIVSRLNARPKKPEPVPEPPPLRPCRASREGRDQAAEITPRAPKRRCNRFLTVAF